MKNTRYETISISLANGSSVGKNVRKQLDTAYKRAIGVVAYIKKGSDQNFQIGLQSGDLIVQESTYFKDFTIDNTSTLNPNDRFKPISIDTSEFTKIVVTPNETLTSDLNIDFVFFLAKD